VEHTDVELIKRTLSGDQDAFTVLVRRYDKRVHALAWRKTGDFHIAEDITQDTFLRAYRNLGTLKNPNLFAGWLYVIANRLCDTWFKRSRPQLQSLEATPTAELEETLYSDFTMKQREKRASEQRIDLVKRLLQRLPESERIVITLHYLAESTIKEISEFLGVSQNTVKSRLYRARQRLQKEDNMLRETLGSFQPTTSLTENIVRVLKETGIPIDSTAPSGNKPLVPWVIATSTFILIALMLGFGANQDARFQQPYSLDATSVTTVDIVDAAVLMNLPSDPDVRNQVGNINAPDKNEGTSQNPDAKLSSSASGKIVDEAGNPVNDVRIAVMPAEYSKGGWYPKDVDEDSRWPDDPLAFPAHANKDGNFVINSFDQGTVLLGVLPYYIPEYQIVKVKIGGMNFYSVKEIWGGIILAPEPGKEIKNVEVTVRHFLKVQGKVQQVDGTALSNARLKFEITQLRLDREGIISESGSGFGVRTDVKGNFEKFVPNFTNGTAFYIMSIKYQERIAMSKPVVIKHGDRTHEAVFAFKEPLIPSPPEVAKRENQTSASVNSGVDAVGVWVVNPENGHAYKKIRCDSPEDAMVQATDEGTHLVTINNEAEEKWLRKVFNTNGILIGLNDIEVEGQWQWRNGEPVEYTNWDKFEPKDTDNGDEDYVVLTSQGWKDIGEGSIGWHWIRTALLEKDNWSIDK